jgi:flagellar motor switch protein FliM
MEDGFVLYAGDTPTYRVMPGTHRRHLAVQVHDRVPRLEAAAPEADAVGEEVQP